MWAGLLVAVGVLVVAMLLTMLIPEKPIKETTTPMEWRPIQRLIARTALFTLIILGLGQAVKLVSGLLKDITSPTILFLIMGIFGLLGMLVAVARGVWLSVRISLGDSAREKPSFTWWVINRLAFLVGAVNLSTFEVFFLQARLGYVKEAAAAPSSKLILFVGVFILISTLLASWLTDWFGVKRMVAMAGLVAVVGTIIALSIPSLPVIYVGGCIMRLGGG